MTRLSGLACNRLKARPCLSRARSIRPTSVARLSITYIRDGGTLPPLNTTSVASACTGEAIVQP
eukprot:3085730-Prymnesium_polylepis.3